MGRIISYCPNQALFVVRPHSRLYKHPLPNHLFSLKLLSAPPLSTPLSILPPSTPRCASAFYQLSKGINQLQWNSSPTSPLCSWVTPSKTKPPSTLTIPETETASLLEHLICIALVGWLNSGRGLERNSQRIGRSFSCTVNVSKQMDKTLGYFWIQLELGISLHPRLPAPLCIRNALLFLDSTTPTHRLTIS